MRVSKRIRDLMNTAVFFRQKHDKSGGMLAQEYCFLIDEGLKDSEGLCNTIAYAYSLGYRRGYNQGKKER